MIILVFFLLSNIFKRFGENLIEISFFYYRYFNLKFGIFFRPLAAAFHLVLINKKRDKLGTKLELTLRWKCILYYTYCVLPRINT